MIVFDTETTGLLEACVVPPGRQPRLTQICAIKLDDVTLEETSRFVSHFDPDPVPVNEEAAKKTGLTTAFLKGKPKFTDVYVDLCSFFIGERTLVAHNIAFDRDIMFYELSRIGKQLCFPWPFEHICTVEATEHFKGHRLNLGDLHEYLFGEKFADAHDAVADTEALMRCVVELRKRGTI